MAGRYLMNAAIAKSALSPARWNVTPARPPCRFYEGDGRSDDQGAGKWIVQGDFEPESGYRAMQQILRSRIALLPSSVVAISWQWAPLCC